MRVLGSIIHWAELWANRMLAKVREPSSHGKIYVANLNQLNQFQSITPLILFL